MNITITDLLRRKGNDVFTVSPDISIKDAIHEMVEHKIGALLVQENGNLAGIITERDILHALDEHAARILDKKVGDLMTSDVFTGSPGDDLSYVMTLMHKQRFRHMPVIDDDKLVGLVSSKDVMKASLDAADMENRILKHYVKNWPEDDTQDQND